VIDVRIDAGGKIYRTSVVSFSFNVDSIISLKYEFTVVMTDVDKTALSLLEENDQVKIYVGQENDELLIGEGDITNIDVRTIKDIMVITASFQNHTFKRLQTTRITNAILNGEPIREITNFIASKGFKTVNDVSRSENVRFVVNSYLYNILRRWARDRGVIWNVSRETLFVGNKLSTRKHYLKVQEVIHFTTSFLDTNGVMHKKHDLSLKFNSGMNPGDTVVIDKKSYLIGRVVHRFAYVSKGDVLVKTSNVFCFEKIDDLYWYAEAMDAPFHDVDHMLDDRVVEEIYDVESSSLAFKNVEKNLWVCENEKVVFSDTNVGPAQSYLFVGGVQCTATVGMFVPYDAIITDVRAVFSGTDIAYIEVMKDGIVQHRTLCNNILKYEKIDLRIGTGVVSARYTPGVGAAGITNVLYEINYRKVHKV
jgi:hypothetical protein